MPVATTVAREALRTPYRRVVKLLAKAAVERRRRDGDRVAALPELARALPVDLDAVLACFALAGNALWPLSRRTGVGGGCHSDRRADSQADWRAPRAFSTCEPADGEYWDVLAQLRDGASRRPAT
jgi:hypothetical protein